MSNSFTSSLKIDDLLVTHSSYNTKQIEDHNNFYEGGRSFPLDRYLRKKDIETLPGGDRIRKLRVGSAYYSNQFSAVINDLLSTIVIDEPGFEAAGNEDFWNAINKNADGLGGGMGLQVLSSLRSRMLFNRSYYQVVFKKPDVNSLDAQLDGDGLKPRIIQFGGDIVDDWEYDDNGNLKFIRKHIVRCERSGVAGAHNVRRHFWIYHAPEGIFTYTAVSDDHDNFQETEAKLKDEKLNLSGVFQIVEVKSALDLFIADNLFPIAKQLFNAASDASFARFTSATCVPVWSSANNPEDGLKLSAFTMLNAGLNGKLEFATAPAQFFDALDKATEKHSAELWQQVHAMAASVRAQSMNGQNTSRESAAAKSKNEKPLHAFLNAYASSEISALEHVAGIVKHVTDGNENVEIKGLCKYKDDDDEEEIEDDEEKLAA